MFSGALVGGEQVGFIESLKTAGIGRRSGDAMRLDELTYRHFWDRGCLGPVSWVTQHPLDHFRRFAWTGTLSDLS